jgi:hypothetical protein
MRWSPSSVCCKVIGVKPADHGVASLDRLLLHGESRVSQG